LDHPCPLSLAFAAEATKLSIIELTLAPLPGETPLASVVPWEFSSETLTVADFWPVAASVVVLPPPTRRAASRRAVSHRIFSLVQGFSLFQIGRFAQVQASRSNAHQQTTCVDFEILAAHAN
jgi:hypothetical protein